MRLQKAAALTLLFVVALPAFGLRNVERASVFDRLAQLVQKIVRVIVPHGGGLIPPIPAPAPDPKP